MKINEITNTLKTYRARVKLYNGSWVKTSVEAENSSQAMQLLKHLYINVSSVTALTEQEDELDEQQTITATPSELKHEKVVNYLTNKITRIKNRPKVTQQDVLKAVERYKTRQKRANLELEKQQELQQARDK